MSKYFPISIICLLVFLYSASAQTQSTNNKNKSKYDAFTDLDNWKKSDDDCIQVNNYSVKDRLSKYPFNKASKILAVSYHSNSSVTHLEKSIKSFSTYGLHVKEGVLDCATLVEIKLLNKYQINKLTNIIYNITYGNAPIHTEDHMSCFMPRNALIFIGNKGKVFDYLEICFECLNTESLSNRITIGTVCNQKYQMLKRFFIGLGIKTGTIYE
ncbi:hypothetical protein [Mucilaginibacter terrae]|nr:hypothetical protein [Mucilaginibacter terrae]